MAQLSALPFLQAARPSGVVARLARSEPPAGGDSVRAQ